MIILITAVGALGLNILTGYTGLISLGHVGFLVIGAYAYAVVVSKYGCRRWSASWRPASSRHWSASSSARRRCGSRGFISP